MTFTLWWAQVGGRNFSQRSETVFASCECSNWPPQTSEEAAQHNSSNFITLELFMTNTLNAHETGLKHTLLSSAALLCCDHRICNRGIAVTSSVWNKTEKFQLKYLVTFSSWNQSEWKSTDCLCLINKSINTESADELLLIPPQMIWISSVIKLSV